MPMGFEGETRQPGGVEAGRAYYYVDFVVVAFFVCETCGCYGADRVGKDSGVGRNESFEISRCWRWTAASGIEVLGYHLLDETRVMIELVTHFGVCVFTCETSFLTAFDDEFEALVEFVLNLFAILQVLLGIFFEVFELFLAVYGTSVLSFISWRVELTSKVCAVLSGPGLSKACCDPYWRSNPVVQMLDLLLY